MLNNQTVAFGQFDRGTGVLTGVSSGLAFNSGSSALTSLGTKSGTSGTVRFQTQASILATTTWSASSYMLFGNINETIANSCLTEAACFPSGVLNLSANSTMNKTDTTWLSPTAVVAAAGINDYVGTGNLATTLTVQNSVLLQSQSRISGGRATSQLTGLTGSQSLTYSYLRHANASFSSGADAGNLILGAGSAFSIFNFGDASSAKLDFVSLECVSGDCGAFNVTLPSFQDLAAGGSVVGSTALTAVGGSSYSATYDVLFSDDTAVGATDTHLQNSLRLTVQSGSAVPPVPEPAEWTMLVAGLLVMGFIARRRRHNSA